MYPILTWPGLWGLGYTHLRFLPSFSFPLSFFLVVPIMTTKSLSVLRVHPRFFLDLCITSLTCSQTCIFQGPEGQLEMLGLGRINGVLREPGQHSPGGPSCSERIFHHQMSPWTKLAFRALEQTLADHLNRLLGRIAHCVVGAEWVILEQQPLGTPPHWEWAPGKQNPYQPYSLVYLSVEHTVGMQSVFVQDLILSSRLEKRGTK